MSRAVRAGAVRIVGPVRLRPADTFGTPFTVRGLLDLTLCAILIPISSFWI